MKHLGGNKKAQNIMMEFIFIDKQGNEHIVSIKIQKEWLNIFGLDSINTSYMPIHCDEIKKVTKNKCIKLTKGSLLKLTQKIYCNISRKLSKHLIIQIS